MFANDVDCQSEKVTSFKCFDCEYKSSGQQDLGEWLKVKPTEWMREAPRYFIYILHNFVVCGYFWSKL